MGITLIGIGLGNIETLTMEAVQALHHAGLVIGAERILSAVETLCVDAEKITAIKAEEIHQIILDRPEKKAVCVVFSGDTGLYSGAKGLLSLLDGKDVTVVSGISSLQYFAARLKRPWQSMHIVSGHGKSCPIVQEVMNHRETFFLTGGTVTPESICRILCSAGLSDVFVTVGENLSYSDEKIESGTAQSLLEKQFGPLNVVLVENTQFQQREAVSSGIADEAFLRGKTPMTKAEIRSISLSKLAIYPKDVLYDIGAGTGSVAVEMALQAKQGVVYAVEEKKEACALLRQNRERFGAYNLQVIQGIAPECLQSLPMPNKAFIGGTNGQLEEILLALLKKNPSIRIVMNAITLETLSKAVSLLEKYCFTDVEIIQASIAKAKAVGKYHMMLGENPIFILSGEGGGHEAE